MSGRPVTLSCWYSLPERVSQVLWRKTAEQGDTTPVASYAKNGHQSIVEQFVGRVDLSRSLGDTQLTVQAVRTEDEACYTCEFHTYPDGTKSATACLSVYGEHLNIVPDMSDIYWLVENKSTCCHLLGKKWCYQGVKWYGTVSESCQTKLMMLAEFPLWGSIKDYLILAIWRPNRSWLSIQKATTGTLPKLSRWNSWIFVPLVKRHKLSLFYYLMLFFIGIPQHLFPKLLAMPVQISAFIQIHQRDQEITDRTVRKAMLNCIRRINVYFFLFREHQSEPVLSHCTILLDYFPRDLDPYCTGDMLYSRLSGSVYVQLRKGKRCV